MSFSVTGRGSRSSVSDAYADSPMRMAGFQLPLDSMKKMNFVMSRPARHKLDEVMEKVDLVHLQTPFWVSFAARAAAARAGKPVVAAFHVQPENALMNIGVRSPLFAMADLMVHASEVELEGIAVLEAMRIGLPALVADGPEIAAPGQRETA